MDYSIKENWTTVTFNKSKSKSQITKQHPNHTEVSNTQTSEAPTTMKEGINVKIFDAVIGKYLDQQILKYVEKSWQDYPTKSIPVEVYQNLPKTLHSKGVYQDPKSSFYALQHEAVDPTTPSHNYVNTPMVNWPSYP